MGSIRHEVTSGKRTARVKKANQGTHPSLTPAQRLGREAENVITFEHVNVNEINSHDKFIELQHTIGILELLIQGITDN